MSLAAHKQSCLRRPSVSAFVLEQDVVIFQAVRLSAAVGGKYSGKYLSLKSSSEMCSESQCS